MSSQEEEDQKPHKLNNLLKNHTNGVRNAPGAGVELELEWRPLANFHSEMAKFSAEANFGRFKGGQFYKATPL